MSKGSRSRIENTRQYADNYERIFSGSNPSNLTLHFEASATQTVTDTRKWGHAYSADAETWQSCDSTVTTREEAIAEGREYYGGDSFAICRCEPIDVGVTLPSADDICEQMAERAGDNYGWTEDYPDVSKAGIDELNELLAAWAEKHVTDFYWQAADIEAIDQVDPFA